LCVFHYSIAMRMPNFIKRKIEKNYIINLCGLSKLQITSYRIKINSEIYVVDQIYKLLTGVKFC